MPYVANVISGHVRGASQSQLRVILRFPKVDINYKLIERTGRRLEGKDYIVKEADVIHFRFNV